MAELTRLEITVEEEQADRLFSLLALNVPHGWEEKSLPTGELQCIVHSGHAGFCAELERNLAAYLPEARVRVSQIEELDWVESWKEFFTPVQGGEHFLVVPPWLAEEAHASRFMPIVIEPRQAFGTGHHATTALCLHALSKLWGQGLLKPGMRFMDLGTGSGILGLAAAKLGMQGEGADIDPVAVDNAAENRSLNQVVESAFCLSLGGAEQVRGPYDLILANILAEPLKAMAEPIAKGLAPEGFLVLSGMLNIQADAVAAAYQTQGLRLVDVLSEADWVALVMSPAQA